MLVAGIRLKLALVVCQWLTKLSPTLEQAVQSIQDIGEPIRLFVKGR
jgi:hypothetical protein